MDNPGLSHLQASPVQPNAASGTKCSRDQQKFSLNDAHEQTVQRVHQVQVDLLSLGAAAPLRRQRGHLGGGGGGCLQGALPGSPPLPRGMALAGYGRHHCGCHRHCAVQVEEARCSDEI